MLPQRIRNESLSGAQNLFGFAGTVANIINTYITPSGTFVVGNINILGSATIAGSLTFNETTSVIIGSVPVSPGTNLVSIGDLSGLNSQGSNSVAIGYSSGNTSQGIQSVAVG